MELQKQEKYLQKRREWRLKLEAKLASCLASGLAWVKCDHEPELGTEMVHKALSKALEAKITFTEDEWLTFSINPGELRMDNYIMSRDASGEEAATVWYKPASRASGRKRMRLQGETETDVQERAAIMIQAQFRWHRDHDARASLGADVNKRGPQLDLDMVRHDRDGEGYMFKREELAFLAHDQQLAPSGAPSGVERGPPLDPAREAPVEANRVEQDQQPPSKHAGQLMQTHAPQGMSFAMRASSATSMRSHALHGVKAPTRASSAAPTCTRPTEAQLTPRGAYSHVSPYFNPYEAPAPWLVRQAQREEESGADSKDHGVSPRRRLLRRRPLSAQHADETLLMRRMRAQRAEEVAKAEAKATGEARAQAFAAERACHRTERRSDGATERQLPGRASSQRRDKDERIDEADGKRTDGGIQTRPLSLQTHSPGMHVLCMSHLRNLHLNPNFATSTCYHVHLSRPAASRAWL